MEQRLPAHVEATALIRRVNAEGGFAVILRKGDPDRGTLTLVVMERGEFRGILEREMGPDFRYRWALSREGEAFGPDEMREWIAAKQRFDADFWLIELDIAQPERFIAETISSG